MCVYMTIFELTNLFVTVIVYACFLHYEKAFNKVRHGKLLKILLNTNTDDKDIRIIANLQWKRELWPKTKHKKTQSTYYYIIIIKNPGPINNGLTTGESSG